MKSVLSSKFILSVMVLGFAFSASSVLYAESDGRGRVVESTGGGVIPESDGRGRVDEPQIQSKGFGGDEVLVYDCEPAEVPGSYSCYTTPEAVYN